MNNSPENITFYAGRELPDKNTLAGCSKFFYGISRNEIEACNTSRLLENFGPSIDRVSAKSLRGKVHFFVHGYDDVDVHIFRIPEILKFYAEIHLRTAA